MDNISLKKNLEIPIEERTVDDIGKLWKILSVK